MMAKVILKKIHKTKEKSKKLFFKNAHCSCFIIKQYARRYIFSMNAQIKNFDGKLCGFLVTDSEREKKGEIFLHVRNLYKCAYIHTWGRLFEARLA